MYKRILFGVLVVHSLVRAQWKSIGDAETYSLQGNAVVINAGSAIVRVSVLSDDVLRIRVAANGVFGPDKSVAVIKTDWRSPSFSVDTSGDAINIKTVKMTLRVRKHPLRLAFLDAHGAVVNEDDASKGMGWDGSEVRVWKKKPADEYYFGLGEKAGSFNRTERSYTMWNSDIPAYKADTDPLYQTVPFFYGIRKGNAYGIFFDNSYWSSFDFGKRSPSRYSFGAEGGEINYYYFAGPTPEEVLTSFTDLVGRMPLPPRWSLGYQQCRWSYYPESRVRNLAATFRAKNIPCDVVYLDIDYMEGYRIFTWSKKNFPEPQKMIADLANDGFKFVVIVDPGIKLDSAYDAYQSGTREDIFLKYPDGKPFVGKVWPGDCEFPDFSNPAARQWWGRNFKVLTDAGVRGFWNDMNEPSVFDGPGKTAPLDVVHYDDGLYTPHAKNHNTYGLLMTEGTYEGVRALRPNERPFVLTRASYAGGQRYAAAWTGDNESRWDNLEMALAMSLGVGISGQPFIGSDIGGFVGMPSGELFARWLQLGVFTPLMRAHSVINSPDKEPWAFGERFERINRETIDLRYKFLPLVYTVMEEASRTGLPAMRPMIFSYPDDPAFIWNADEFMFGDNLLVAPVLWPGDTARDVQLPKGIWYNYWTNERVEGGRQVRVPAPIDRLPLFVKAGATIPTQGVVQYSDQNPSNPITFTVYPSGTVASGFYEDDGKSFAYETGVYARRSFAQKEDSGGMIFTVSRTVGSFVPAARPLTIRFVDVRFHPSRVTLDGKQLATTSWRYDGASRILELKTSDSVNERTVRVSR